MMKMSAEVQEEEEEERGGKVPKNLRWNPQTLLLVVPSGPERFTNVDLRDKFKTIVNNPACWSSVILIWINPTFHRSQNTSDKLEPFLSPPWWNLSADAAAALENRKRGKVGSEERAALPECWEMFGSLAVVESRPGWRDRGAG